MFRLRRSSDDGSVILAMLAVMMVTSLVFVILATVVHGESQNRYDRNHEHALLLAEAAHSQIASFIQSNGAASPADVSTYATSSGTFTGDGSGGGSGNVAWTPLLTRITPEGTYSVRATRTTLTQGRQTYYTWKLEAEGVVGAPARTRNIESEMLVRSVFGLAAFGKMVMNMSGDNFADSFYSTEPATPLGAPGGADVCILGSSAIYANMGTPTSVNPSGVEVNMCSLADQGQGTVATNGRLDLQGNTVANVDLMEVYNAREHVVDPLPDATGYCQGPPGACDSLRTAVPQTLHFYRDPIELPAIEACTFPAASVPTSYNGGGAFLGGTTYDIQDIVLDGNSTFTGTGTAPVVLCVRGNFSVADHHLVNFVNAGTLLLPRWVPRRPGSLLIFVTGAANSTVSIGGNAALSAALYAPNNDINCAAQGNMFGSMVGNTISCQGGFRFHYDQALGDNVTFPAVRAQNWRELYG